MTPHSLGNGEPRFCDECGKPYREINRIHGSGYVGLCPRCFESALTGGAK